MIQVDAFASPQKCLYLRKSIIKKYNFVETEKRFPWPRYTMTGNQ